MWYCGIAWPAAMWAVSQFAEETDNLLSSVIPHTAAASSSSPLIVTTMTTIRFVIIIRQYGLYNDDDDDNDGPNLTKCYISGGSAVYERVPSHTSLLPRPSHFAHSILFEQLDGMLISRCDHVMISCMANWCPSHNSGELITFMARK